MRNKKGRNLQVNVELEGFVGTANGVWTAYRETLKVLRETSNVQLVRSSNKRADIVHFHSIGPKYIWAAHKNQGKTIVSAHVVPRSFVGSIVAGNLWKPLGTKYLRYVYNLADLVLAVSPFVKDTLYSIGVESPVKVLPNCVDTDKFYPDPDLGSEIRNDVNLKPDSKIVMAVGQLQPRKGLEDFLKVAERSKDYEFVWVGGHIYGPLSAASSQMDKMIENAPENVIFPGVIPYEKMSNYYNAADLFFLPSYQENFPFVILEAAACGLPIMLRDIPEYEAILSDNYLKGKSVEEFAENIKRSLENKRMYKDYRERSLEVAKQYDHDSYLENLLDHYYELYSEEISAKN
ncbi:glycosyltransferase family 4 protein [Candidatus Bipolaricaulota bacterium]|nr:glycosyltransferase family 4 protein [Candidatus Bipolaricaulota bacterium]